VSVMTFILLVPLWMQAQVASTHYYLKYNPTACYYEAHLVVVSGSTSSTFLPLAGNLQFTIVVPHFSPHITITKVADVNPFVQGSTTPVPWNMPSTRLDAPAVTPNVDYIALTLNISGVTGTKVYPALSPNTDIILTTFTLSGPLVCGAGVRMWRNNADDGNPDPGGASVYDPSGAASGMLGADFNNSFTVSNPTETYTGNASSSVNPPNPVIVAVTPSCTATTFTLAASATPGAACAGSTLTYSWTGPGAFTNVSTVPSFTITSPTSSNSGSYFLTVTDANSCSSTFAQGYNAITCSLLPLPIKLSSFDAIADKCDAIINWNSLDLSGTCYYELQYSGNGQQFSTIAKLNANAGNSGGFNYRYTQPSGNGYYRLKVTEEGGKESYSQIITVATNCGDHKISIAPNPTSTYIKVSGVLAGNEVRIIDQLGQVVTRSIANSNMATLDLSSFPAGVYKVMVIQGPNIQIAGQVVKR